MFVGFSLEGPRLGLTPHCDLHGKLNRPAKVGVGLIVGDGLIVITAIAILLLSKVGHLQGIPPAALYVSIGAGGVVSVAWIGYAAKTKGTSLKYAATLLKLAMPSFSRAQNNSASEANNSNNASASDDEYQSDEDDESEGV